MNAANYMYALAPPKFPLQAYDSCGWGPAADADGRRRRVRSVPGRLRPVHRRRHHLRVLDRFRSLVASSLAKLGVSQSCVRFVTS